ncbi:MAG: hypothetical protein ACRDJN_24005, partial [Chloroflexota bacterium]
GLNGADAPSAGYLEFHSYYQSDRTCRPYLLTPELFSDLARRAAYQRTSAALRALSDGAAVFISRDHERFDRTLVYAAAKRFGTAGHLYKLTTRLSPQQSYALAIEVLERYLLALADW